MRNYIESADLNIQGGLLAGTIAFKPGLNLISGENGTFKTKLLQSLAAGSGVHLKSPTANLRRQAISPKRNAQRRAFQQIYAQLRQQNVKLEGLLNTRGINDAAFEEYPALGDLFYVVYEDFCRDGGNQIDKMQKSAIELNRVISRLFLHYALVAT